MYLENRRDDRDASLSPGLAFVNFYDGVAGNPRYRYHYHAPFVIKCGGNIINRFKYSRTRARAIMIHVP